MSRTENNKCCLCARVFPHFHRPSNLCQKCAHKYYKHTGIHYDRMSTVGLTHSIHRGFFDSINSKTQTEKSKKAVVETNPLLDWVNKMRNVR